MNPGLVPSLGEAPSPPADALVPPPLVTLSDDPIGWLRNKAALLMAALVLAHIGTLIIVAVYYLLFETNPTVTSWWHQTVSDSVLRHNIRSVAEGLLGGFLAQQVVWNHYKKRLDRAPTPVDRAEVALHIPNVHDRRGLSIGRIAAAPFFAILYAIPGFVAGYLIVRWTHSSHDAAHILSTSIRGHASHRTLSVLDRTKTIWTQDWPQKAMGLGASFFFGRRPMRGVFDDVQLWFVERRLGSGKPLRWYHAPTFKARYNGVVSEGHDGAVDYGFAFSAFMLSVLVVGAGLAVYGWYVLTYIAQ